MLPTISQNCFLCLFAVFHARHCSTNITLCEIDGSVHMTKHYDNKEVAMFTVPLGILGHVCSNISQPRTTHVSGIAVARGQACSRNVALAKKLKTVFASHGSPASLHCHRSTKSVFNFFSEPCYIGLFWVKGLMCCIYEL